MKSWNNNIVLFIFSLNSIPGRIAFLSRSSYRLYADREGCTAPGCAFSLSYSVYYIYIYIYVYVCNPKIRGIRSASVLRRSRFTDEGFFFPPIRGRRTMYVVRNRWRFMYTTGVQTFCLRAVSRGTDVFFYPFFKTRFALSHFLSTTKRFYRSIVMYINSCNFSYLIDPYLSSYRPHVCGQYIIWSKIEIFHETRRRKCFI